MNEKMKLRRRLYELDFAKKRLSLCASIVKNAPPLWRNTVKSSAI